MIKKGLGYKVQGIVIFLLFVLLSPVPNTLHPIWAAASPSPSPNALTEFQQKVEDIKKEAASKAATIKSEVSQTIQNKAFIGTVTGIQGKQLTLQAAKGARTISTDQYTVFQDSTKKTVALKDLKNNDYLIALGDVDDNQVLKAKKIIRTTPPQPQDKYVAWGQIQSIIVSNLILLKGDNQKVTINTSGNTIFKLGASDATLQDLKTGNFVISVGSKLNNNNSTSQFIYLLNPKGDLNIIKPASASATPSASPKTKK